jgi:hypothetical protein
MLRTAAAVSVALVALGGLALAPPAQAARALAVTTETRAVLLSPTQVEVRGSVTCVGGPETGSVGVVLVQPPGSVAQDGGGSAPFACEAGETVRWAALVTAHDGTRFRTDRARYSTYASTPCSDTETDCPSADDNGTLAIRAASRGDGVDLSPTSLRFGRQAFGSFTKRTFTITNTGSRTLDVSIDSRVMPDDFSPGQPESTCPLAGVGVNLLLPGDSCTHTVGFQPDPFFEQPESALMSVTARDLSGAQVEDARVRLSGRGY